MVVDNKSVQNRLILLELVICAKICANFCQGIINFGLAKLVDCRDF